MQDAITRCLGLVLQYNPLTVAPGALSRANDCVINRENIVEDRRGYATYLTIGSAASQLTVYSGKIIAHNGTLLTYDSDGTGTPASYSGSYNAPSGGFRIRAVESYGNLYFTSDQGVQVLTDTAGTAARKAGAPRSLDPSSTLNSATSGFLAAGAQCAYRAVIQRTDANSNVLYSYPSTRLLVSNQIYSTTGTITNGSPSLTSIASTVGITAGQTITGNGITAGTTVSSIAGSTVTMSANAVVTTVATTGDIANASNQVKNLATTVGIAVGMNVTGAGIPGSTTVLLISGTTITLSANATSTAAASALTFTTPSTAIAVSFSWSKNVDLKLYLPAEVTTSDVIQFYRTAQVSGTASDLSGDEMALVYQVNPTSSDISNGFLTFTDSVTDALRGAALYTSPSQEGISQANDRPPLAKDLALYKSNYMIYANTSTKQRLFFTLVGTTSLTGQTLILGGVTYNFGSTEIVSGGGSPQIAVGATGVAAVDIDSTARSLVRVINRYASNTTIYAYYLSGPDDLPGQILVEERGIGGSSFTLQASNAAMSAMTYPNAPVSPATNVKSTSSNSVQKNYLYYSKSGQPEAVPSLNYLPVGASNKQILRIAPLRDSLIIIKEDGVFVLRGETPASFSISPLDLTVICKAMHSVSVLSNQVFMLSNQGVVAITETGVQVISREIEPLLKPLLTFSNVATYTAGAGYESERTYFISTVSGSTDTAPNQTFAFNIFTKTWVRWTFGFTAAIVETVADKIYFAKPSSLTVYRERKDFADTDYADPELAISISTISGSQITFTMVTGTPVAGGVIVQGSNALSISSVAIGSGVYTATIKDAIPASVTTGAASYFPSVGMDIEWDTWSAGQGNAGMLKQVSQAVVLSDNIPGNNSATGLSVNFKTNFDEGVEGPDFTLPGAGWGAGSWGSFGWGGSGDSYGYRTWVPSNKQYCRTMNVGVRHSNSRERLVIAGLALSFRVVSDRVGT